MPNLGSENLTIMVSTSTLERFVGSLILLKRGIFNRIARYFLRSKFKKCGKNVKFDTRSRFTYQNICIGDDVYIGPNAVFSASNSELIIGSKVLFGPNVAIICGDHNTSEIGSYMFDVTEKKKENDLPVVIENDVWIGANVIILKGVIIKQGSIIAAGSIVTKSTRPYSVYKGAPASFYKSRWDDTQLEQHMKLLYPLKDWNIKSL